MFSSLHIPLQIMIILLFLQFQRKFYLRNYTKTRWEKTFSMIREYMGEYIVILMRLNVGFPNSPLHVFSQKLSPEEQREFLRYLDGFLLKNNVLFSYPVFGLYIGPWDKGERKTLSRENKCRVTLTGESHRGFHFYDSLAPEFKTYDTIKELAQNRSEDKNQIRSYYSYSLRHPLYRSYENFIFPVAS
ncbi:MAG TPA: hypothetical protein ENG65_03790 [Candidatus Bathyarchaeota archaeon]|nr:hypothetical protein [Candidatus Bathyarchaeota archaeon]